MSNIAQDGCAFYFEGFSSCILVRTVSSFIFRYQRCQNYGSFLLAFRLSSAVKHSLDK